MKKAYSYILKGALLALGLPLAMSSCSFDEDYDCHEPSDGTTLVQLHIRANDPEAVASTRFAPDDTETDGTEAGTDGEYINSLCILIVDGSNNVVSKIAPDLTANEDAKAGNLKSYSELLELSAAGTYTVYAFANISDDYYSEWSELTSGIKDDGTSLLPANIEDIVLDDPAGKLDDLKTRFIPMSAKATFTLPSTTSPVIEVGLDRLVSKIRITVAGDAGTEITSLRMSGWADKVTLMDKDENATIEGAAYSATKTFDITQQPVVINENGTTAEGAIADFYVNETLPRHNFNVEVTTNEAGTPTYTATTARDNLPRNCIYPLTLNLNKLDLDIKAWFIFPPIGEYLQPSVEFSDGTYNINLPDGMPFEFTAEMNPAAGTTLPAGITYTWAISEESKGKGITLFNDTNQQTDTYAGNPVNGTYTATGHIGSEYHLTLDAAWTGVAREYKIKITTVEFQDSWLKDSNTRSGYFLQPEILNMFIKR